MNVRYADGLELVHALRGQGLYPVSGHAVVHDGPRVSCTCGAGTNCSMPGKHPVGSGWQRQVEDEALKRLVAHQDWNLGHLTGSISGTTIVDVDHGQRVLASGETVFKKGYETLAHLEARLGPLPPTVAWMTGSGTGEQRIFRIPPGVMVPRNSVGKLGVDIDIRGEGGYGVLPPSNHRSGGRYCWREGLAPGEVEMAPLPESWLAAILALVPQPRTSPVVPCCRPACEVGVGERQHALRRARAYVSTMGPAVSGSGGHDHTFSVACRIVERVLTEADAWEVLDEWNAACQPPWSESELRHKLADALRKHALGELLVPRGKGIVNKALLGRLLHP